MGADCGWCLLAAYHVKDSHCSLLTAHCSLLTTHYSLLTTHQFTVYYLTLTTHYSLLTTSYRVKDSECEGASVWVSEASYSESKHGQSECSADGQSGYREEADESSCHVEVRLNRQEGVPLTYNCHATAMSLPCNSHATAMQQPPYWRRDGVEGWSGSPTHLMW